MDTNIICSNIRNWVVYKFAYNDNDIMFIVKYL